MSLVKYSRLKAWNNIILLHFVLSMIYEGPWDIPLYGLLPGQLMKEGLWVRHISALLITELISEILMLNYNNKYYKM